MAPALDLHSEMNLQQARQAFQVSYYRWAIEDFRREIDEGVPFLRALTPGWICRFLALMEQLRRDDQFRLARALIKRFHREALTLTGEYLSAEEARMIENYQNVMLMPSPEEQKLFELETSGRARFKVNRKKFAALIKEQLVAIVGDLLEPVDAYDGWYTISVAGWTIRTYVDTGGRYHQLCYDHTISAAPHMHLQEWINLLSWLGLSSQTMWQFLNDGDISRTATALGSLCAHFMQALPKLLEGSAMPEGSP